MRSSWSWVAGASVAFAVAVLATAPARAVGEKENGFPSWEERVLLELANRARVDPQFEMDACGSACSEAACYTPQPPLRYNRDLGRAARFHADEMVKQGFFDHPSHCTLVSDIASLYPDQCDGSASCACVGGVSQCNPSCTDTSQRVNMFAGTYSGEIIASGGSPESGFYLWLYENGGGSTACKFSMQNGHRWLILTSGAAVGFGASGYFVGDFGGGGETDKIASGTHWPQSGSTVEVHANWYDSAGPKSAMVNVDGDCKPMTLERGTVTNGTYHATLNGLGSSCHRYFFVFTDTSGQIVTYPTTGSLGIGPASSCDDWNTDRPATGPSCSCTPDCNGKQCGDDGCGGVCGNCGTGTVCQGHQCVPTGAGGSGGGSGGAPGGGGSGGSAGATGGSGVDGGSGGAAGAGTGADGSSAKPFDPGEPSGCACSTTGSAHGAWGLLAAAALVAGVGAVRRKRST